MHVHLHASATDCPLPKFSGGYTLNPEGQPHSALIGSETVSLVIYHGEPDEIVSLEVVDVAA